MNLPTSEGFKVIAISRTNPRDWHEEDFWRSVYKCDEDRNYEAEQYAEKKRGDGYRIKYQELSE